MIHLLCALKSEARPLIEYYHLQHVVSANVFPVYCNRDKSITLTISGIGKINAAAATSYTHVYYKCRDSDPWLNIGIAGHQTLDIGQASLAHKILDAGNQQIWYPQIIFTPPCLTMPLTTLDMPSTHYEQSMFDMEASGFYSIASRFATTEIIHVFKIISDNFCNPADKPDEKKIISLVEQQLSVIDLLVGKMLDISSTLEHLQLNPVHLEACTSRWHFSHCEQHRLMQVLRRWQILRSDEDPLVKMGDVKNGKEFITSLEKILNSSTFRF